MQAKIIITDDNGNTWESDLRLTPAGVSAKALKRKGSARAVPSQALRAANPSREAPDLTLPIRAFVKRHARGLSGSRKFTLLVAHLSAGDVHKEVSASSIEKQWNRMTGLLGDFNAAHSTRAKDEGWVDSPKKGMYKLRSGWEGSLPHG